MSKVEISFEIDAAKELNMRAALQAVGAENISVERLAALTEHERRHQVGRYGETLVREKLTEMYGCCTHLGATYPCFDLWVDNGADIRLIVAVETRNHTTAAGTIKSNDYNVLANGNQVHQALEDARRRNAVAGVVGVTINAPDQWFRMVIYLLDDLPNKKYIPMSRCERDNIIAEGFDPRIRPEWSNVKSRKLDS